MTGRSIRAAAVGLLAVLALRGALAQATPTPAPAPAPAIAPAPAPAGTPHLVFDATEANLGQVVRGEDAVATFTYRNTGDAPVRILSAKPG